MFNFSRKSLLGEFGAQGGEQRQSGVGQAGQSQGGTIMPPPRKPAEPQAETKIGFGTGLSNFITPGAEAIADVAAEGNDMSDADLRASGVMPTEAMGSFKMTPAETRLRTNARNAQAARQQARMGQEARQSADDMAGYDYAQGVEQDPEDYIAQAPDTPEIREWYAAWNKRRDAIQAGLDSSNPQDFADTIAYIKANKGDPKFMNMLHPQTKWMAEAYDDAITAGKDDQQARDAAYEVGAYRYMDEEAMASLGKAGQEIKAGVSTLWGANADAATYDAIANDPSIPEVYKNRLLTQIAGKGTEYAIDAATTFTPVGRMVGAVQSFGKGRLDASKRGANFWGQVGGGAVHGITDKVAGRLGQKIKGRAKVAVDESVNFGPVQKRINLLTGAAVNSAAKHAANKTKQAVMGQAYGEFGSDEE